MYNRYVSFAILCLLAGLLPDRTQGAEAPQVTWHVASDGSGARCSQLIPCALATAQAAVRARTATMQSDLIVRLHEDGYRLKGTWEMSERDCGKNGFDVIYENEVGQHPRLSGGQPALHWRKYDAYVWEASVGALETRHLFVDGIRVQRAFLASGIPGTASRTADGFRTTSQLPQNWSSAERTELVWRGSSSGIFAWAAEGRLLGRNAKKLMLPNSLGTTFPQTRSPT